MLIYTSTFKVGVLKFMKIENENTVSQVTPVANAPMIGKDDEEIDESIEQVQAERRKFRAAHMGRCNRGKAMSTKNIKVNKGVAKPIMNENEKQVLDEEEAYLEESVEGNMLINEAILEDMDIELSEEELNMLIESELLSERSIVRLDKVAKRSLAEKKALIVIAKEKNDPLYRQLVKVYKRKREIIDKIDKKYGSQAIQRVRSNKNAMSKKGVSALLPKPQNRGDIKAPRRDMPMKPGRRPGERK